MGALMSQLAAVQQLASTWLSSPPQEVEYSMRAENPPLTAVDMLSFEDRVWSHSNNAERESSACKQ
jgi:hypothetical protein